MSDLFGNKIAAAILASALGFIGINKISEAMVGEEPLQFTEYAWAPEMEVELETPGEIEAPFPTIEWIDGRDAVRGAKVFKKCTSCHNADKGGKNGTGPNLYNVVGRSSAGVGDFSYSAAMTGANVNWGYEELDLYLEKPSKYVPKTAMNFIGIKKASDRAAVIEYLRLQADTPVEPLTVAAAIPGAEAIIEAGTDIQGAVEETIKTLEETAQDLTPEVTEPQ